VTRRGLDAEGSQGEEKVMLSDSLSVGGTGIHFARREGERSGSQEERL
jgi:hypothetical protein